MLALIVSIIFILADVPADVIIVYLLLCIQWNTFTLSEENERIREEIKSLKKKEF